MKISWGLTTCLYGGIQTKIDFVKKCMAYLDDKTINQYITKISDALAFYQEECVVSGALLQAEFESLITLIASRSAVKEVNANEAKSEGIDCAEGTIGELRIKS